MIGSRVFKKIAYKLRSNTINAANLSDSASRFACKSQFGDLYFWDTQKPYKSYDPEVISCNEQADTTGEPYDFRGIDVLPDEVIIDIGAHVGTVTVYLAKLFPHAKIFAFEPMPSNFECLKKNLTENNIHNVTPVNAAVTKDGRNLQFTYRLSLGQSQTPHMSSSEIHKNKDNTHETVNLDVNSVSLNEFFKAHNIHSVRLLKIDCEGAEYEVLYNYDHLKKTSHIRGELHSSAEENNALINFLITNGDLESYRFTRNKIGENELSGFVYYANQ